MLNFAFITSEYQDSDFSSGGVKLNYIVLKNLKKIGYSFDLYSDKIITNKFNLPNKIFHNQFFDKQKIKYDLILSDKAITKSDITYIHDHSYIYRQKMMSNKISHFFYKIFNRKKHLKRLNEFKKTKENICNTKKVIVSSKILKKDIIENYGVEDKNIIILPPPIENYEKKERIKNDVFTFGISTVGFVRKGGYLTLKAIKILKKQKYKFKVKFIYPSKKGLINFLINLYGIKDYCEFLPIQKNMDNFYYSIDCLLMPSIIEPFGMVTTEALSTGCPVVTGTHCGASDIIIENKNGYLYSGNKSVKNLAKAMQKALINIPNNKYNIENFCINSVKDQNLENFINKYVEIIEAIS